MNETGEANTGYVPTGAEDALKVPDSFGAESGLAGSVNCSWSMKSGKTYAWG